MTGWPSLGGMVRKGMYAGVGTTTGEPGRAKWRIVASRAGSTEAARRTWPGSTSQPKRRRWKAAVASATAPSSQGGW